MDNKFDVAVISCFGRGHWMAAEFAQQGLSVALVEVSEQLGRWAPEDYEGPFGLFHGETLTASQKNRLQEEDIAEPVPEGFMLWLKHGVLDTLSTNSKHLFKKFEIRNDISEFIEKYENHLPRDRERLLKQFLKEPFRDTWFLHLAYQLASPIYHENHEGALSPRPLPLFSPHFLRQVSRRGFDRSLEWVASQGATVYRSSRVKDLSFQANFVQAMELSGGYSGALLADQYVWCLSSSESYFVSENIGRELYPSGPLKSEWYWARYRVELKGDIVRDLPTHSFGIEELGLSWTHENLFSILRTPVEGQFDVWMRLPTVHRFQRAYLVERGDRLRAILQSRLPKVLAEIVSLPPEHDYDPKDMGPPVNPIYSAKEHKSHSARAWINLNMSNSEVWPSLDWTGQMLSQQQVSNTVLQWKHEKSLTEEKHDRPI